MYLPTYNWSVAEIKTACLHEIGASGHPMVEAVTGQLFVSEAHVRLLADPYDTFGRQSGT